MDKEFSKDYARETIDKAVDVFVDLILEDSKLKYRKTATNLLTSMLEAILCTSNTFESNFFNRLGEESSGSQSLFLSNEMMLPIVRTLALIKETSERKEIAKALVEQISDRIEKIWSENNLTFHELISLIESYVDVVDVVDVADISKVKRIIKLCYFHYSLPEFKNKANTSKFKILYWAFVKCSPDLSARYVLCDALDEHYSKES